MTSRSALVRWLVDPEPPGLGLDLRSGELALARLSGRRGRPELDLCLTAPIPADALSFAMLEPNIRDEQALAKTIEDVLARAGLSGAKRLALTVPDPVARVAVVELPEVPHSSEELDELLKFRLKKSLPFDVTKARIAYERLPGSKASFLTGVMHEAVAAQYEDFFAELGLQVGLLKPASVSLLELLRPLAKRVLAPGDDFFFVNVEREYFTVSLVRDREVPVLIRTLGRRATDETPGAYTEDDLIQDIIPTAIYYKEKLQGTRLARVFYRSLRPDLTRLTELLEGEFETRVEPLELGTAVGLAKNLQMDAQLADAVSAAASAAIGKAA